MRLRKKSGRLSGDRRNAFRRPGMRSASAEWSPAGSRNAFRRRGTSCGGVPVGVPVIGKISAPRGERVEPLLYYLYGPGRREEHTDPHIIAGWRHPAELEPPLREDGRRDYRRLFGLLPAARRDGHVGVRPAGLALLDAGRARRQDAVGR